VSKCKYLGIVVARTILTGDITGARREAAGRTVWTVAESRAIAGACREANRRWGCDLSLAQFTETASASERGAVTPAP
jgi:hypothetical protein